MFSMLLFQIYLKDTSVKYTMCVNLTLKVDFEEINLT